MINTFEGIDADNRIKMVIDPAGDDGHYAAPGAGVELCSPGAERVLGYERGIFDDHLEGAAWIRGPHATVLGAKGAGAGADWNFGRIRLPSEGKRDVPAMAFTVDQHARDLGSCST